MSIFGSNFTFWKSAADQRREQDEYSRWAFPYGERQQEKLKELLAEVFSSKDSLIMFTYLTGKEMYDKALADCGSHEAAMDALLDIKRRSKVQIIKQLKKDDWHKHLAIVQADRNIDEKCEYPSAYEIIESAKQIGKLGKR